VFITASFGDIIVRSEINAKSGPPDGLGGDIELFAQGVIDIQSSGQLNAEGGGGQSDGGDIFCDAKRDITVNGLISALGGDGGGDIELDAGRNITVVATVDSRAMTAGGFGGAIAIEAGILTAGNLSIVGTVDVSAPGCDTFGFCSLGGDIDLFGCDLTVEVTGVIDAMAPGSEGNGGTIFITGRNQLTIRGTVDSTGAGGPLDGMNKLVHPIGTPPVVTGTVTPTPVEDPRSVCTGGGGDPLNCLVPCPACGNGLTEFPETCDDTTGTPESCDGCSTFCQLENCDDQSLCTIDSCGLVLGCRHQLVPSGTVCRPAAGDCDLEETCTGTGPDCPVDAFAPGGGLCRGSAGPCDLAESCTGAGPGCPTDAFEPSSTVCRPVAGGCDAGETCTGAGPACPADALEPAGAVCRPAADDCDVDETCSGGSPACPADAFAPAGGVCRSSAGQCDPAEVCPGGGPACPADVLAPSGTVCRSSAGACDPVETCSGASPACPVDALEPGGTVCRPVNGGCDAEETCSGVDPACPADIFEPGGTVCRPAAGSCDLDETCSGGSPACPANAFAPAGGVCRSSAGQCDPVEVCPGTGPACPADALEPSGTVCRSSAGACDPAETCSGGSPACPADALEPGGTVCRPANGGCDAEETCTGASPACPADIFQPLDTVCRPDTGDCDVEETCTGASPACPSDAFEPAGTPCDDAEVCTIDDACDAANSCLGDPMTCGDGVVQGACGEECDDGETSGGDGCTSTCTVELCYLCTGEPSACSPDVGASCDDGDVCTNGDICDASAVCAGEERPRTGCLMPLESGGASLKIKDRTPDKGDQAIFKWAKGPALSTGQFGNPVSTSGPSYTLCVYDELGGTPSQILKLTAPPGSRCRSFRPCWKSGKTGFKYNDRDASPAGLQKLQLKAGGLGKSKVQLKARGDNLTVPALGLSQDSTVTAQLVGSHGLCFAAEFSSPAKKNEPDQFKDKSD
jgi:cysteine-rich repeat protein